MLGRNYVPRRASRAPLTASSIISHPSGMLLPRADYDNSEEVRAAAARLRILADELERRELSLRCGEHVGPLAGSAGIEEGEEEDDGDDDDAE